MTSQLEYHVPVRHSIPASVALFALFALLVFLVPSARAQINGAPTSVTSPGFGGRPINGTRSSVTSLGPNGYAPNAGFVFTAPFVNPDGRRHHHHHFVQYAPPVVYALPVPYAVDISATDDENVEDNSDDADYQGGPTIFDRRGSGATSYIPGVRDVPPAHSVPRAVTQRAEASPSSDPSPSAPEAAQSTTLLVFRDGHKIEVGNYAIVSGNLMDLTPGHFRRIALADLDLDATRRANDDRGVTFQIPPSQQAN